MPRRPNIGEYCGNANLHGLINLFDEILPKPNQGRKRKRDKALIATLFLTGAVIDEVLQLRKANFDFDDSEAQARNAFVVKKMRQFRFKRPRIVYRTFPIFYDDPLVKYLLDWLPEAEDYLFSNQTKNRPLTRQTVYNVVRMLRKQFKYKIGHRWLRQQRILYFVRELGWSKYHIQQYFKMESFLPIHGDEESWRNLLYIRRKQPRVHEKTEELSFPNVILERLPKEVKKTVLGVMSNYYTDFPRFCFWGMRTALIDAIRIRFKKDGKEKQLYVEKGKVKSLPTWIDLAKQEKYISAKLARFLRDQTKVFGDISSHDYMVDMRKEEVPSIFTQLRFALDRMYYSEK